MKPLYSLARVAGAGVTNVAFLVIQSLLFIILTPLVLRFIGKDAFGVWIILQSIIGFSSVANFKLGVSANKFVAQYINHPDHTAVIGSVVSINFLISFLMGALATAVLFVLQGWLANNIESGSVSVQTLKTILAFVSLSILPIFLSEVSVGILFGLLRYGIGNSILLGHQLLVWAGVLVIGWFGMDFVYVGVLIFVVNLLRFVTATFFVFRILRPSTRHLFRFKKDLLLEIFQFTKMNWLGALGMLLFNSLDKIIVGLILGAATAGVYGIATGIGQRLSQLIDQATHALIPYASSLSSSQDHSRLSKVFYGAQQLSANAISLISTGLIIWMPEALSIWISVEFSENYSFIFRLILLGYSLFSLYRPAYKISTGLGWVTVPNWVIFITAITMNIVLIAASIRFGLTGAVMSNFVFIGLVLINFYTAYKLREKAVTFVSKAIWLPMGLLGFFSYAASLIDAPNYRFFLFVVFLVMLPILQQNLVTPLLPNLKKSLRLISGFNRTIK